MVSELSLFGRENFKFFMVILVVGRIRENKNKLNFFYFSCFVLIGGRRQLQFYNGNFDFIVWVLILILFLCVVLFFYNKLF